MLPDASFYDCISSMYQFIKPYLDNKMSILEEYGAFKNIHLSQSKNEEQTGKQCMS